MGTLKAQKDPGFFLAPIENEWRDLWWGKGVWEPCGVDGTKRVFPSKVTKGDIVYYELADRTLQMGHRPLAAGCAVLNVGEKFHADATPDGLTTYGVFESNTRPGYRGNSHIGNNGAPTGARIGNLTELRKTGRPFPYQMEIRLSDKSAAATTNTRARAGSTDDGDLPT